MTYIISLSAMAKVQEKLSLVMAAEGQPVVDRSISDSPLPGAVSPEYSQHFFCCEYSPVRD